jgi:hypothetical protein
MKARGARSLEHEGGIGIGDGRHGLHMLHDFISIFDHRASSLPLLSRRRSCWTRTLADGHTQEILKIRLSTPRILSDCTSLRLSSLPSGHFRIILDYFVTFDGKSVVSEPSLNDLTLTHFFLRFTSHHCVLWNVCPGDLGVLGAGGASLPFHSKLIFNPSTSIGPIWVQPDFGGRKRISAVGSGPTHINGPFQV